MKHLFLITGVVVYVLAALETARADSLNLDWNASTSANVAGYNVYYGTNSGNFIYKVDAGNATSVTVSNLSPGLTYYFAATAYDLFGDESGLSAEISFIVPGVLCFSPAANGGAPASLSFPVEPGHWYEIQASTDLQNWTSIWQSAVMTTNDWTQVIDPAMASFGQRFYRLAIH
ncbi:MAG TPA: fibronectin type III domain-containing protein [Candidatus Acidoferrales bacterium]|nr:fibronectin type III domain-containing protein [Candidatus Acidoferrales bacterium]